LEKSFARFEGNGRQNEDKGECPESEVTKAVGHLTAKVKVDFFRLNAP
jgi:hypothetical protein